MSLLDQRPNLVDLAARYLQVPRSVVEANNRDFPEVDAVYFWEPTRGGGSLLIGTDETMLFANSSVTLDAHLDAFKSGKRTSPEDFRLPAV